MATAPTDFTEVINEGSSATYTVTLKDELDVAIPLANMDSLTLSLCNLADGSIINSRNDQNVLNLNNVTIHATSGLLTFNLQNLDNIIVDANIAEETHQATFKLAYNSNANHHNWDVNFKVRNLAKVV